MSGLGPPELEVERQIRSAGRSVTVHAIAPVRIVLRKDVVAASVEVERIFATLVFGRNHVPAGRRS